MFQRPRRSRASFRPIGLILTVLVGLPGWVGPVNAQNDARFNVLTNRNDSQRSGIYRAEETLTPAAVGGNRFAKLFEIPVKGFIYAQPLYVAGVTIHEPARSNGEHNILLIATEHNLVYAFDADNNDGDNKDPLWVTSLGAPVRSSDFDLPPPELSTFWPEIWRFPYKDLIPEIGITGTPVVDAATHTLYVVAATHDATGYHQMLYALDIETGQITSGPVSIGKENVYVPGVGDGQREGSVPFDPRQHLQRPGLLLDRGTLFVAFGSHGDQPNGELSRLKQLIHRYGFNVAEILRELLPGYHGWVLAFRASDLKLQAVYNSTPNGNTFRPRLKPGQFKLYNPAGAGIWMSGTGLAADPEGFVYLATGNGTFDPGKRNYGNSVLKLRYDPALPMLERLQVADYFTPHNQTVLRDLDLDFGSVGVVLLPDMAGGPQGRSLLVAAGKEGNVYLLDRKNLGKLTPADAGSVQKFSVTPPIALHAEMDDAQMHHIHGAPIFFEAPGVGPLFYIWSENAALHIYKYDPSSSKPFGASPDKPYAYGDYKAPVRKNGMPGGFLSLSSNGSQQGSAVLWASLPLEGNANKNTVPGIMMAFDATGFIDDNDGKRYLKLLWTNVDPRGNSEYAFAKFCPPTIARGRVYLATFSQKILVYGLKPE